MYRFRLRTLLAGVTLFAVLLAVRLEYIRRQIAFHRGKRLRRRKRSLNWNISRLPRD
jgi:hypothetical protein